MGVTVCVCVCVCVYDDTHRERERERERDAWALHGSVRERMFAIKHLGPRKGGFNGCPHWLVVWINPLNEEEPQIKRYKVTNRSKLD